MIPQTSSFWWTSRQKRWCDVEVSTFRHYGSKSLPSNSPKLKKKQQMKKLKILSLFLGSISFNVHGHLPDLDNALLWDCVNFIDKPSRMYNPNSMFLQYQILPNFTAIYSRLASGTLLNSIYESLFHISHTNILVCAHLIIAPCLALLFQGRDRTGIPSKKWLSSQTATPTVGLTLCWRRENFNVVEVRK